MENVLAEKTILRSMRDFYYSHNLWKGWLIKFEFVNFASAILKLRSMGFLTDRFEELVTYLDFSASGEFASYVLLPPSAIISEGNKLFPLNLYDIYLLRISLSDDKLKRCGIDNKVSLAIEETLFDDFVSASSDTSENLVIFEGELTWSLAKNNNYNWCFLKMKHKP